MKPPAKCPFCHILTLYTPFFALCCKASLCNITAKMVGANIDIGSKY